MFYLQSDCNTLPESGIWISASFCLDQVALLVASKNMQAKAHMQKKAVKYFLGPKLLKTSAPHDQSGMCVTLLPKLMSHCSGWSIIPFLILSGRLLHAPLMMLCSLIKLPFFSHTHESLSQSWRSCSCNYAKPTKHPTMSKLHFGENSELWNQYGFQWHASTDGCVNREAQRATLLLFLYFILTVT